MKVGTPVRNEYQGILRFGKVKKLHPNYRNDGWTWCEVEWVDDEKYQHAISHRNKITSMDHSKNIYRADELDQLDIASIIQTLTKLK